MKISLLMLIFSATTALATGGIVITPLQTDQIVEKMPGDCFFGEVTPQGCAWVFPVRSQHFEY